MTQSGANLPFVSPLRADKLPNGFQISMLRRSDKTKSFGSAGDILATVEQQDGVVSSGQQQCQLGGQECMAVSGSILDWLHRGLIWPAWKQCLAAAGRGTPHNMACVAQVTLRRDDHTIL